MKGDATLFESMLVCPACNGELVISSDQMACIACRLDYGRLNDWCVDLLPSGLLEDERIPWQERQQEMDEWYENLIAQASSATSCFLNDYVPLKPVLEGLTGVVLDLGGGNGIARHFLPADVQHVVVDPSMQWLEPAWASLAADFPCLADAPRFVRGVGEHLPFRPESFDVVLALWSLNHVLRPGDVFREVHRVLKPGGRFLIVLEDMEPAMADLVTRRFQRGALRQVATALRADLPATSRAVFDHMLPGGRVRDTLIVLMAKIRHHLLGRRWPVQADHIQIAESEIHTWIDSCFEVARREWVGHYLNYELAKYPGVYDAVPAVSRQSV